MINPWTRWTRFLDEREPGAGLALFRSACGLVVFGAIGSVVCYGLVPVLWLDRSQGGFIARTNPGWLFHVLGVTPSTVWMITIVCLVAAGLLVAGLASRVSAFVAMQCYLALTNLNPASGGGGDDVLLGNALWLLVLANSTATLSLSCRLRTGSWTSAALVPAWPRYLAIFQLVLVYFTTGVQKVSSDWVPGGELSALYYILQEPSWQRWDMSWLAWVYPLTQLATLQVWLFEVLSPLLLLALWYRRTADRQGRLRALFNRLHYRGLFILVGVAMHLGIMLLMNVEPFSWVTLSFYICLIGGREWQALGQRLAGWIARPATATRVAWSWWPQVRAALISLHLVAVSLLAFPAPPAHAVDPAAWQNPRVQEELHAWAERFQAAGIDVSPAELEESAFAAACRFLQIRDALVWPFQPYYEYCGTYQSWRMFTGPEHAPTRLQVDIQEYGQWRTVHVERDPERTWLDGWLSHHRMRPAVESFAMSESAFEPFAAWIAESAERDFPEARRVRVRYWKQPTPTPEELRAGHVQEARCVCETVIALEH
jgi:hypothetical protein